MLQLFTTKCLTFEIFHSDDATSCFDASGLGRAWGGAGGEGGQSREEPLVSPRLGGPAAHTTPRVALYSSARLEAYSGEGKRALGLVWVLLACFFMFPFFLI